MREFKDSVTGKDDDPKPELEQKPDPVRAEKSEATPAGGHGS
jgi:hypothetical protein